MTTQFLVGELLRKREPLRIYAGESLDTSQIGRGEYLLLDTAQGARGEHTDPNIWYWRASEAVSLCGAAAMGIWVITVYRKKSGREDRHVEEV